MVSSSIFALPSRSTLTSRLSRIPFKPGINLHIQENLKHQSTKLKDINKNCILIFDEMALSAGLRYDKKNDMILGLQKNQNSQTPKFADHALVFMLRGIARSGKQPYAYYYSTQHYSNG
ncbi:unnamed protein product [Macrosiphum euphorbiae]|uniref:Transposable element P transposase-like RNase H domain-containing protein n=1 Tax=Macrosiphum euphorbiae TaxID=13131 RepID=A0AAV0YD30_9HEMI|nr:unnamed protein product [Macrosiphum euphorbiae]